jgi:hypothetical protein
MTDVIETPEALPETTTERLRKVAHIIRTVPENWYQGAWATGWTFVDGEKVRTDEYREFLKLDVNVDFDEVEVQQGRDNYECGTRCCIAGWAVRYTPKDVNLSEDWTLAGAEALGLDEDLADIMFSGAFAFADNDTPTKVAHLLDRLADVPEVKRDMATIRAWASEGDEIMAQLFKGFVR